MEINCKGRAIHQHLSLHQQCAQYGLLSPKTMWGRLNRASSSSLLLPSPFTLFVRMLFYFLVEMGRDK